MSNLNTLINGFDSISGAAFGGGGGGGGGGILKSTKASKVNCAKPLVKVGGTNMCVDRDTATEILKEGGGDKGSRILAAKRSNEYKECMAEFNNSTGKKVSDVAAGAMKFGPGVIASISVTAAASNKCMAKGLKSQTW